MSELGDSSPAVGRSFVRILALTRYGALGASSRMRFLQYVPFLESKGMNIEVQELFGDKQLSSRYEKGGYSLASVLKSFAARLNNLSNKRGFDLLWIEKEALPWWPLWVERIFLKDIPYVLDYDDAVFHNYDRHRSKLVRFFFGKRLDGLMSKARLVVAGNEYLADRARCAKAPQVEILPTVIDLRRYAAQSVKKVRVADGMPRIVWIGSPSTANYLRLLEVPLRNLAQRKPYVLRVIGADVEISGVKMECVAWSEDTEVASIAACDIGIMPLLDSEWERGKCGYKLIQYMGCGLPVVASRVGVNEVIVQPGINGYLADNPQDWEAMLGSLLEREELRDHMGKKGRLRVENEYSLQVAAPRLSEILCSSAKVRS